MSGTWIWLRRTAAVSVVAAVTVMVMAMGVASSEPLKDVHEGTVADCSGAVEWHFIHNQTDEISGIIATSGTITVGGITQVNGEPFSAAPLHYWVTTGNNVLPGPVSDDVDGGKLVLSHYTCLATSSTSSTTSTSSTSSTTSGLEHDD